MVHKVVYVMNRVLPYAKKLKREDLMQTNPYEDDRPLPWIPQQNQFYEGGSNMVRSNQQPLAQQYQGIQQRGGYQTSKPLERMPKTQALELVNVYKKRLIVASLMVFGLLSGLVAFH